MEFKDLDYTDKLAALRKYLGRYIDGMKKLRYLQAETEGVTVLKGVQYGTGPRSSTPGDPVPATVFKYQRVNRRISDHQAHILQLEDELNDLFDLLDDITRLMFEAVFLDGHTYETIASIIGVNARTIMRRINSGLDLLLSSSVVLEKLGAYYSKHPEKLGA